MTTRRARSARGFAGAGLGMAAAVGLCGGIAVAQTPPPTNDAAAPPPQEAQDQHGGQPDGGVQPEYKGQPNEASAGGSERKLPDYAGLFPNSPVSVADSAAKKFEKWTSDTLRLDLGFRAAWGFQQASAGPGDRTAMSQDYRVYGTWHAINWEEGKKGWAGNVYARFEWRSEMFTKIPPAQLSGQIGALAPTTYGFDEHDPAIAQLYYEQFLFDGGLRLRAGKIDPDDYFDLGRWADDYRYFYNTLFSAFPTANHPSGGLGFNAQWYITPEWTLTGGLSDVVGRKTLAGFDTFFGNGNFIDAVDITYSPTIKGLGKGNYRFGYEHRDEAPEKDKPADDNWYFNVDQEIAKDVAPFLRIGWGTGRSTGVALAVSGGLGIENCFNRPGDAFGVGIGFDTANDRQPTQNETEYVGETFYRWQLTRATQFTLGGQLIANPVNAPHDDLLGVLEMRVVIDF